LLRLRRASVRGRRILRGRAAHADRKDGNEREKGGCPQGRQHNFTSPSAPEFEARKLAEKQAGNNFARCSPIHGKIRC
jgi:hypothetical protein